VTDDPLGSTFAALADPTRRHVVRLLSDRASVTASELARELPITRQAVAKHLRALGEAGLVEGAREGRETRYRLTPDPLSPAAAWIAEVGAEWERRLARLAAHARERGRPVS
jgi:DNA-binding transcriptional ArsR family regulator